MPLPINGTTWPPKAWDPVFEQYRLNNALYAGDVTDLHTMFAGAGPSGSSPRGDQPASHYNRTPGSRRRGFWGGLADSVRTWFWGAPNPAGAGRTRLHSPLAGNLATLSADVLMSEPPAFRLLDQRGEPMKKHPAQQRMDDLLNDPATRATLMQAAEYCAGLSAVALTVQWDRDRADRPWIGVVACDGVVPEWEAGRLSAVTLWTTYPHLNPAGAQIGLYYHLERHEVGRIVHALYLGNDDEIGLQVPIDSITDTAYLAGIPGSLVADDGPFSVALPTGIDLLTATWWRNLPTRRFRTGGILARAGRSDCEGVEHFIDQVDMVWSSWMRDIKLARARLIVNPDVIDSAGGAPTFDDDAEILKGLDFAPTNPDDPPISAHQFEIRAQEHAQSILALTKEILQHAGYSLASYGEFGDVQKTATEVTDRKSATERTRDKKALYFRQAMADLVPALMEVDRVQHAGPGWPAASQLDIRFPELSQVDPEAQARMFGFLRAAEVASTRTMVAERHPDWDPDQVDDEVQQILADKRANMELDAALVNRDGQDPDAEDDDEQGDQGGDDEQPADAREAKEGADDVDARAGSRR